MQKPSKIITCSSISLIVALIVGIAAFPSKPTPPQENSLFLPEVTLTEDAQTDLPITVTPYYNKLVVHVDNIGVDPLDSVTVSGTATDYGALTEQTYSVPPAVGKDFTWDVPQTKCHMKYDVNISSVDRSGTSHQTGHAELDYTDAKLSEIGWGKGTFSSRTASLNYHFGKHHSEVGAANLYDYLMAADDCRHDALGNPSNYTITAKGSKAHKYKNKADKRFIIMSDSNNEILSFGK